MSFYLLKTKDKKGLPDDVYINLNEIDMLGAAKVISKDSIKYFIRVNLKSDNKCYGNYDDEETTRRVIKEILQIDNVDDFEFEIIDKSKEEMDIDKKKELLKHLLES
jgi:hypothetical protein